MQVLHPMECSILITLDIELVLQGLGLDYEVKGEEALALCPQHEKRTGKADHSPSWWINLESGMHLCFSCGYKGNVRMLVCDVKEFYKTWSGGKIGYDYDAAMAWLSGLEDIPLEVLLERMKALPTYIEPSPVPLKMSEARLAVFNKPPLEALEARNLTIESALTYDVLWHELSQTWILPLRDPSTHALLGWQEKGTVNRTFKNRPAGLSKSKTLFGFENQNESLVIVVESPLDCLRFHSAGIPGAVAICGSSISEEQLKLLRYSRKVIAAFDTDAAGQKASAYIYKVSRVYGFNLFFFNYGELDKKDPGDLTDSELHWGVENAKSALYGESSYVQRVSQTVSG